MNSEDEHIGLIQEYFGFDQRRVLISLAMVAGVAVVVTLIYVAIFGFDTWKSNMKQAGNMMVVNFQPPGANGVVEPNIVPLPAAATSTIQYLCPTCGIVGLPRWSVGATPVCPQCGAVMSIVGQNPATTQLAAAP